MKGKVCFGLFAGLLWVLNTGGVFAQQMDHKKGVQGFAHVHALAMDAEGGTLLLGAHTGLFRSEDSGKSWKKLTLPAKHSHLDVMAITPDPRDSKTIYVGTHEAGLFKSTDGGVTWQPQQ